MCVWGEFKFGRRKREGEGGGGLTPPAGEPWPASGRGSRVGAEALAGKKVRLWKTGEVREERYVVRYAERQT